MSRWCSLAQLVVWHIRGIEMPPQEAEQIAWYSPEMDPEVEQALKALKKEALKALDVHWGLAKGVAIKKFRIPRGDGRYIDLLDLY